MTARGIKALIGGILVLLLLVLGGLYAFSPVLSAKALVKAAQAGDEAGLERLVDFPAFRTSLKEELNARMVAELSGNDAALGGLGMLIGPALISAAVDAFVTPQAVSAMVRSAEAPVAEPGEPIQTPDATPAKADQVKESYGYRDLNTFAVTLTREDRPDDRLELLMKRRGLFGWKLAAVDLPAADKSAN